MHSPRELAEHAVAALADGNESVSNAIMLELESAVPHPREVQLLLIQAGIVEALARYMVICATTGADEEAIDRLFQRTKKYAATDLEAETAVLDAFVAAAQLLRETACRCVPMDRVDQFFADTGMAALMS